MITDVVKMEEQNVLMFARAMDLGGTENVVLQICEVLKPHVNKIIVCSNGGESVKTLHAMGVQHYMIPDVNRKDPDTLVRVYRAIKKIIADENITIVHVHDRMAAMYIAAMPRRKFAYFATFHMNYSNKRILTQIAYRQANIIACGRDVRDNLINFYGMKASQVTTIRNTIPPAKNDSAPDETLDTIRQAGYLVVGNVARLTEQKGLAYYIASFPHVKAAIPNVKYVIVGDGCLRRELESQAREIGAEDDIVFLGNRTDARYLMQQMDLVVLSSVYDEGFPLTPVEAFSNHRTMVASKVKGVTEIIQDGYNGLLVEPRDAKQLAEAIIRVLENEELRQTLERNAWESYQLQFGTERFRNETLDFYRSKLAEISQMSKVKGKAEK